MTRLKDKIAVVTGSGKKSGIGYAMAKKFAAEGAHVVIADLGTPDTAGADVGTGSSEEMETIATDLSQRFGIRSLAVNLDVTDTAQVTAMADTVKEAFGLTFMAICSGGAALSRPGGNGAATPL